MAWVYPAPRTIVSGPSQEGEKSMESRIRQSLEITNGNFVFEISCDGKFIKIARRGDRDRGGFFLIPVEAWDEVVSFVYSESKRRKEDG